MAKSVKSLTGPEKDAFLRRALAAEQGVTPTAAQRLAKKLERDLTRVWVRSGALEDSKAEATTTDATLAEPTAQSGRTETPATNAKTDDKPNGKPRLALGKARAPTEPTARPPNSKRPPQRDAAAPKSPFDPFSPNVIVVLRKSGREQVLEALCAIGEADQLRLLAREQQLGIAQDLVTLDEIRLAILAAAERRIANRRAAGR